MITTVHREKKTKSIQKEDDEEESALRLRSQTALALFSTYQTALALLSVFRLALAQVSIHQTELDIFFDTCQIDLAFVFDVSDCAGSFFSICPWYRVAFRVPCPSYHTGNVEVLSSCLTDKKRSTIVPQIRSSCLFFRTVTPPHCAGSFLLCPLCYIRIVSDV